MLFETPYGRIRSVYCQTQPEYAAKPEWFSSSIEHRVCSQPFCGSQIYLKSATTVPDHENINSYNDIEEI